MTRAGRSLLDAMRVEDPRQLELPWGGRSPRDLTRAARMFRFSNEATPLDEVDALIDEQYRRFLGSCPGEEEGDY